MRRSSRRISTKHANGGKIDKGTSARYWQQQVMVSLYNILRYTDTNTHTHTRTQTHTHTHTHTYTHTYTHTHTHTHTYALYDIESERVALSKYHCPLDCSAHMKNTSCNRQQKFVPSKAQCLNKVRLVLTTVEYAVHT